jgi:hypothetical protein
MKQELFFSVHFPSIKPSVFLFFLSTELATDDGITDEYYSDGRIPSVN